jgi:hypothetical protein
VTPSIRKRLTAALRQAQPGGWWETTAVITFPRTLTGAAPRWSPGPGYVEAMTATVWAAPADGQLTRAVVIGHHTAPDPPVMLTAAVSVIDVLGLGGLCDKPHRIRWLGQDTPVATPLNLDHPAVTYRAWTRALADELDQMLRRLGRSRHLLPEQARVSATPSGGFQAAMHVWIEPGPWRRHDIHSHAGILAAVVRHYGPGTRSGSTRRAPSRSSTRSTTGLGNCCRPAPRPDPRRGFTPGPSAHTPGRPCSACPPMRRDNPYGSTSLYHYR